MILMRGRAEVARLAHNQKVVVCNSHPRFQILGISLTVEQRTLTPLVVVRIHDPQPTIEVEMRYNKLMVQH